MIAKSLSFTVYTYFVFLFYFSFEIFRHADMEFKIML